MSFIFYNYPVVSFEWGMPEAFKTRSRLIHVDLGARWVRPKSEAQQKIRIADLSQQTTDQGH